jgi:PAS domain S-box-containing protein
MSAECQFLVDLNRRLRPLRDPVEIQEAAVRLIGEHLHASRVHYAHIDGGEFVIAKSYVDGVAPFVGRGPVAHFGKAIVDASRRGETVVVDDVITDPRFTDAERKQLRAGETAAFVGTPLIKEGRWVATFGVHSRTPRVWTPDEIALVQEVADRIWATLEHRKAEAELRANQGRLAFLLRLNDALRPLSDPAAVQDTAARLLGEHLGVARVGYAEVEGREYVIHREHSRGVAPLAGQPLGISVGGELREALRRGETVVVTDVDADPRLDDDDRATFRSRQIAAFVGVMLFKDARAVAAFGANHDRPRVWTAPEIDLVRDVAERTWDAVERTRAEGALREQGQRLRLALDASAGGSWTWVASTNQVDWDQRFRSLYGFTSDEPARSDAWLPRVHEADRPLVLASLNEMLTSTTKDSWENTFRIVRPDGALAWIQSRGRAERDADGRLTRLTGLDLDFTRHHHTEEALQARRDEEHDRTLQTLLETATQGIVSVDVQNAIVTANRAFEAMFGWPPGALIGQPIERVMPAAFRGERERYGDLCLIGVRKDGSTFPIEVSVNHVPTPGGSRAFAFVTDITERQRAASALQEHTAELEYRTTQLSRMASDLTLAEQHAREQIAKTLHDGLQQLLVVAALNLEQQWKLESERGAAPSELLAEARHHVDEAIAAARSLSLELFPPVLQHSGLPAALKWLANWLHDKYKLDVQIHADPAADSARKDVRTLLFESVRELLFNAVKHAKVDRVALELAVDADDRLCITVRDQGVGFDPTKLDDRSNSGQAGWGLFSIRERLTLLGGRLDIDSAPGRGTRARLVAPRAAQDAGASAIASSLAPIEPVSAGDNNRASPDALRILIVDDHPTVRTTLREILHERPQLSVVGCASNGFEAIAHALTLRPDVVLMDVAMPHMNGVEATARIHAELPDIQILGLSMRARDETVHAIEQAGAASFFVKGIDTQRLIDHLLVVHASRGTGDRTNS